MSVTKVTDAMRNVTVVDGTKISGAVPLAALGNAPATDLAQLEMNQALLAFKIAAANQLAKFSMVDQVIDEFQDATGVNASLSTNESARGATTSKYYEGGSSSTPTTSSVGSAVSVGTVDGDYTYYKWLSGSTGTFTTDTTQDYEILVVAGGGGAGDYGGGGGGGGYRTDASFEITAGTPSVSGITVGAGGTTGGNATPGARGGDSIFSTITSTGGGGGNSDSGASSTGTGGSGGGGSYYNASGSLRTGWAGNTPSTDPIQGYAGGSGQSGAYGGAAGGGAGGVGGNGIGDNGGNGGIGINNDITGSVVGYAGGGGGCTGSGTPGTSSHGGGTGGSSTHDGTGAVNTGGGGGADTGDGTNTGGSGIVVIRRLTSSVVSGANLTLVSTQTDSTQGSSGAATPTSADIVILIEDAVGAATINTHVKAYIGQSANATPVYTAAVTLVDEGLWGTGKRIFAARGIDTSALSGTNMNYKIETLVQSAGGRETRIHATSLAWA